MIIVDKNYFVHKVILNIHVFRSARLQRDENGNATALAKRMDKIAKEYDGIWSINDDEIAKVEKLIEISIQEEDFYDDLIVNTK